VEKENSRRRATNRRQGAPETATLDLHNLKIREKGRSQKEEVAWSKDSKTLIRARELILDQLSFPEHKSDGSLS